MKRLSTFLLSILLAFSFTACNSPSTEDQSSTTSNVPNSSVTTSSNSSEPMSSDSSNMSSTESTTEGKTLIVYFSWSSNTERMANTIQEQTGGDLYEIVPQTAYPTDYTECTEVALEERDNNARPEIQDLPESIEEYDNILIGYPIWWHTAPMIIGTFLESYDLTGVDVYPFSQSASMNTEQFDNSMEFVRECAGEATVHDGLFVSAADTEAIAAYLTDNGLTN